MSDMMSDAYSFPIDTYGIEDMMYNQQLNDPEYEYQQQVINDPATFHFEEQQPEELDTTIGPEQLIDPTHESLDHQKEESPMSSSPDPAEKSFPPTEEENPTESSPDPAEPTSSSMDEEIKAKSIFNPIEHSIQDDHPLTSAQHIKQAAVSDPFAPSKHAAMYNPPSTMPSSLPIKLAAVTHASASSSVSSASTSNKPALASVGPPRQQEKPPMGQHSEPNIPPGIPQQQHPAQPPPANKPPVPPGSDLGTLGRIGVFGEDSFAVRNSDIPFMQILFLCFFSLWFVLCVKRS